MKHLFPGSLKCNIKLSLRQWVEEEETGEVAGMKIGRQQPVQEDGGTGEEYT